MEHSPLIARLKWIFSAGYAKSEIYSPMVSARIFSQVQYLYPTTTMWGHQIANPIPMLSDTSQYS